MQSLSRRYARLRPTITALIAALCCLPVALPIHAEESPVLDASSRAALEASIEAMQEAIPGARERKAFSDAIERFGGLVLEVLPTAPNAGKLNEASLRLWAQFDGMNAEALLTILNDPPEAVRLERDRHALQVNMGHIHRALEMYASDARGERFPPMSRVPGLLFADTSELYPMYLLDTAWVVSPLHPFAESLQRMITRGFVDDAGQVRRGLLEDTASQSYFYLSHACGDEAAGMAFVAAYRKAMMDDPGGGEDFFAADFPRGDGATLFRTRRGIDRIFTSSAAEGGSVVTPRIPVLIARPHTIGEPVFVLYLSGVREVPFGEFPNTTAFLEGLASLETPLAERRERLKGLSLALKTHNAETRGELYPRMSQTPGRMFFELAAIYPAHIQDRQWLVSPLRPNSEALGTQLEGAELADLEAIGAKSYFYFSHALDNEQTALAFAEAYREKVLEGTGPETGVISRGNTVEGYLVLDIPVAERGGTAGLDRILRLREGVERFLYSEGEIRFGPIPYRPLPVLLERPAVHGDSVLAVYASGRVDPLHFGDYPNSAAVLEALESISVH